MAEQDPAIARDGRVRAVALCGLAVYAAAVLALGGRPALIGSRTLVMPGMAIAADRVPAGFVHAIDQYGVHLAKAAAPRAPVAQDAPVLLPERARDAAPDLRFGYAIVETSVLGAPYLAWRDDGHVLYYETPGEWVYAPVNDAYLRRMALPGAPLTIWRFAWWRHVWGWLVPLALLGYARFEIGAARRRRAASGIL